MSKIIGLVGFKQVGKSTAAKYLEEHHGFVRHNMKDALVAEIKQNFPDLLKEILFNHMILNRIKEMEVDDLFNVKPPLMRALLQNYGTEVRRRDDNDYWVKKWLFKAVELRETDTPLVVDDVRFLNEANYVKRFNHTIIRLTRPDITTGGSHASEIEQLEIVADYTIECAPGDHEHLYRELDKIVGAN